MKASELRARVLEEHALLRGKAEVLEALALRVIRGDEDLGSALRLKGEEIEGRLAHHILWEEDILLPELRRSGHGDVAEKIRSEHRRQRERISDSLVALQDAERRPIAVARHLVEFVRLLEQDICDEEESMLARSLGPTGTSDS